MIAIASSPASSLTLAASSSSTALSSTSASAAVDDVCVPPPNSRLAQLLRHQQSQSLPGTKNKQSGRQGPSGQKLRYAYSSANAADNGAIAPLFYHLDDDDKEEQADLVLPQNNATHHNNNNIEMQPSRRRKRMRMLRFMDRPFSSNARRRSRQKLTRRQRQHHQDRDEKENEVAQLLEYEQRKAAWAAKYTSVSTLRSAFGTNKNRIWGDFDPVATRKLYHTLLPRALLELRGLRDMMLDNTISLSSSSSSSSSRSENNNNDYSKNSDNENNNNNNKADLIIKQELKELAPLAYQARVAAKKYARERSRLPGRIGSMLYDGYRQWRRYGKWDNSGMSWEQVWNKYEDQVLSEVMEEMMMTGVDDVMENDDDEDEELASATASLFSKGNDLDDEELTARICLRILERSVATNEMVDRLFRMSSDYENTSEEEEEVSPGTKLRRRRERQRRRKNRILKDLQAIEKKFDDDIQELLQYSKFTTKEGEERRSKRKKGAFFWKKSRLSSADQANDKTLTVNDPVLDVSTSTRGGGVEGSALESPDVAPAFITPNQKKSPSRKLASHEVVALRILATTKQRIQSLQEMKQDEEGQ